MAVYPSESQLPRPGGTWPHNPRHGLTRWVYTHFEPHLSGVRPQLSASRAACYNSRAETPPFVHAKRIFDTRQAFAVKILYFHTPTTKPIKTTLLYAPQPSKDHVRS